MIPDEAENEQSAENGEGHISVHHLLKFNVEEEATEDSPFDLRVSAVAAFSKVAQCFLELCLDFILFTFVF